MTRTHRISRVVEFLSTDALNEYLRDSDGTVTAMAVITDGNRSLVLAAVEGRHPMTEKDEASLA